MLSPNEKPRQALPRGTVVRHQGTVVRHQRGTVVRHQRTLVRHQIAVDEYATALAHSTAPNFVPLVLFEDPDVMQLRVARLKGVHMLNTAGWLLTLHREGLLPEALELVEKINSSRATPLVPFEKVGLTKCVR